MDRESIAQVGFLSLLGCTCAALDACALQEMVHQLLTPDVVSSNAANSACEKGKQWEGALRLLQEQWGCPT